MDAQTKGLLAFLLAPQRRRKELKKLAMHRTQEVLSVSASSMVQSLVLLYLLQ
jgi:hypothetical protein